MDMKQVVLGGWPTIVVWLALMATVGIVILLERERKRERAQAAHDTKVLHSHASALALELRGVRAELTAALARGDRWKESASEWRKETFSERARFRDLYDAHMKVVARVTEPLLARQEPVEDPPTVGASDMESYVEHRRRQMRAEGGAQIQVSDDALEPPFRVSADDAEEGDGQ